MVDTAEERALDIYRVPARRLGLALLEVRRERALTRRQVEQACGGHPNIIRLRAIERGRRRITADELDSLTQVYDIEISSLMPSRQRFAVDLERGVMFFNGAEIGLVEDSSPSAVLAQYLGLVRAARLAAGGSAITLRSTDLRVLGTAFGTTRASLRTQLADVMGVADVAQPTDDIDDRADDLVEDDQADEFTDQLGDQLDAEAQPGAPVSELTELTDLTDLTEGVVELADVAEPSPDSEPESEPAELAVHEIERPASTELVAPGPERSRDVMLYGDGPRELDAAVVTQLEDLYDALSVRPPRWWLHSRRRTAERRLQLVTKESALLEELGYESWTEMLIGIALGEATLPHDEISIPGELVDEFLGIGADRRAQLTAESVGLKTMDVPVPSDHHAYIAEPAPVARPVPASPSVSTSGSTSWQEFANHRVTHTDAAAAETAPQNDVDEDWAGPLEDEDLSRFDRFDSLPSFVDFNHSLDEGFTEETDATKGF